MVNITIRNGIHRYHTCYLLHLHPTPTDYRIWHLACLKWGVQAHAHRLITQNYQVPAANITLVSIFHPPSLFGVMREMLPNQASHKDFFFAFSIQRQKNHQFTSLEELRWWRKLRKTSYSVYGRSWTTDLMYVVPQVVHILNFCEALQNLHPFEEFVWILINKSCIVQHEAYLISVVWDI